MTLDDKIHLLDTFSIHFQLEMEILANPEGSKANHLSVFDVNNPWFVFQQLQDSCVILEAMLVPRSRLPLPGVFTVRRSWEE